MVTYWSWQERRRPQSLHSGRGSERKGAAGASAATPARPAASMRRRARRIASPQGRRRGALC
eukprot:753145-Hanusia_phi.AAC.3